VLKISIPDPHALGASSGQECIEAVVGSLRQDPTLPTRVLVSFGAVEETNASFVKATLLYFFNCGRMFASGAQSDSTADDAPMPLNCFPAVTGCNEQVFAEVEDVFRLRQLPFIEIDKIYGDEWISGNLRGHLDPALLEAFRVVSQEKDGVTAATLRQRHAGRVAGTAWNNRLEALHTLRLVQRFRVGREWKYEALTGETNLWVSGSSNKRRSVIN
jgi:hypothetical protein